MTAGTRGRSVVQGQPATYLEAGRGQPLVLLHGAGGRAEAWTPQLAGLADVARVVAVDLPGHGETGGRGCRSIDEYAAWVLGLLDALGLDRVVLGGHSMGGGIAQTLALGRPDRLRGLVLVGTGARLRVLPRILELFREGSPAGPELVASLAYSPRTPPGSVVEAERALRETATLVTLGDFMACDRFDLMTRLHDVEVPTLVLGGQDDRLTPPKYAAFLAGAIPGARLVEIEAAGHFAQLEQPDAVNGAIRDFLTALP
ncbi:MAG: alpha/beta hydrolase [Candidatus Rokubacteria bacterium]|nr:alpha/beta hydrolase [Candidatus Rokubacteria bacterium]